MKMLCSVLIAVMVAAMAGAADCPDRCSCNQVPGAYDEVAPETEPDVRQSVECHHANAEDIARYLPETADFLKMYGSGVDLNVLRELFSEHLELIACNVTFDANTTYDTRLKFLQISSCGIEDIPIFNSSTLKTLDLSRNKLPCADFAASRTLISLEMLNLSANAIAEINSGDFTGLTDVNCLDLSRNGLKVLHEAAFSTLVNLQYLNLSGNALEVLDEACFGGLARLQQLDVSWNRLVHVVPGNLELPSLARLILEGNPALGRHREPTLLVGTGRRLQTVDASRTGLMQVPAALTRSIRVLRLAGNSIGAVTCGDLDWYPLLQVLDFTSNDLEDVEEDALGRLDSLSVLYLSDNKLQSIPRSLPDKLKVLHLQTNLIGTIAGNDLQTARNLEVVLLNDNRITTIEENAFGQLVSLVTLDLSRNPIKSLPAGVLSGPGNLQILRLRGITALSPAKEVAFPLTAPEHLITLDLSNSPGLAHQLMADTAALAASRELQELDLSETNLEYVRSDLLHFLPQLRALYLSSNPLNCTDLQWLAFWMRKQDSEKYRGATCNFPPELWGTSLVDLQESDDYQTTSPTRSRKSQTTPADETNRTVDVSRPADSTTATNAFAELVPTDNVTQVAVSAFKDALEDTEYVGGRPKSLSHPGMLILMIGVLVTVALLVTLTSKFAIFRRHSRRQSDVEVSSMQSVTELW